MYYRGPDYLAELVRLRAVFVVACCPVNVE